MDGVPFIFIKEMCLLSYTISHDGQPVPLVWHAHSPFLTLQILSHPLNSSRKCEGNKVKETFPIDVGITQKSSPETDIPSLIRFSQS